MEEAAELLKRNPFESQADKPSLQVVGDDSPQAEIPTTDPTTQTSEQTDETAEDRHTTPKVSKTIGNIIITNSTEQQPARQFRGGGGWSRNRRKSCNHCGSGESRLGVSLQTSGCNNCGGNSTDHETKLKAAA